MMFTFRNRVFRMLMLVMNDRLHRNHGKNGSPNPNGNHATGEPNPNPAPQCLPPKNPTNAGEYTDRP
jgi:hypothetical protein